MTENFQTISPIDNSVYLERAYTSDKKIQQVLQQAVDAIKLWQNMPVSQRAEICLRAADQIESNKQRLAEEITHQMGRPVSYSPGELDGFAARARYMIAIAETKLKDIQINDLQGFKRFIRREPLGIVLTISPWNYPYLTAVNSIIPALMAGNVVIFKPSAQTPLIAERIFDALTKAGLPKNVFQFVYIDHETTSKLIENKNIDYVAFTGSVKGGLAVQKAAQERFINIGLELGGKDAAYVRQDAKLDMVVPSLVDGAYFNSGQSCCGIERIYVHDSLYQDFVDGFITETKKYILGNPLDPATTLGPMVNVKAADFVRQQIQEAEVKGATACIDSTTFSMDQSGSAYLAPQVMINVNHEMSIMREESFGPVVGIMSVNSDETAISFINDSEFGLTASVWTNDENAALSIGQSVNTGTFFMNRCDYLDPALAWTGFKNSGRGCTLSEVGYEQLTRPKSFHLRLAL